MASYRRFYRTGGTYFFTVALMDRRASTLTDNIELLRIAFAKTMLEQRFVCDAVVVMPDHLHSVWTLPEGVRPDPGLGRGQNGPGDRFEGRKDYSTRWRLIKSRFSRGLGTKGLRNPSLDAKQERGIWQRRFWEHTIRDEADYQAHIRYCWVNPVRHGFVATPTDWPYSSIHRDLKARL